MRLISMVGRESKCDKIMEERDNVEVLILV